MNTLGAGMAAPLSAAEKVALGLRGTALFDEMLGLLRAGLQVLADKPEETPESAARALWHLAAGVPVSAQTALARTLVPLATPQQDALRDAVCQRLSGVPLAHLTGRQRFMDVDLLAGAGALIPRSETELLGRYSARLLQSLEQDGGTPLAMDVCTGCGNLAIGLAHAVPAARLVAADLSEDAVALARRNVELLNLAGRIELRQGDLLAPFDEPAFHGAVDLLVCNPPYISSAKVQQMPAEISAFEPQLAFDGGPFGVRILTRLIQEAPRFIRPGGWLAFEVGAGQGRAVLGRMAATKQFEDMQPIVDGNGEIRAISARRQ